MLTVCVSPADLKAEGVGAAGDVRGAGADGGGHDADADPKAEEQWGLPEGGDAGLLKARARHCALQSRFGGRQGAWICCATYLCVCADRQQEGSDIKAYT